jgi:hypothetical protein
MTSRRARYKEYVDELQRAKNRVKARVRAKVELPPSNLSICSLRKATLFRSGEYCIDVANAL